MKGDDVMKVVKKLQSLCRNYPVFHWMCAVDEGHYTNLMDELDKLVKASGWPEKIVLYLNNLGGDLSVAWAFYEYMRITGLRCVTVATGNVESAAVVLFLAGRERYASRFSSFLIHDPTQDSHMEISIRNIEQTRLHVASLHERYLKILSHATGLSEGELDKISEDASPITPERAKELRIVRHIF